MKETLTKANASVISTGLEMYKHLTCRMMVTAMTGNSDSFYLLVLIHLPIQ